MPGSVLEKTLFSFILLAYICVGAFYAIYTPAWQAPDEPAHYNYIRQIAQDGCCPVIRAGDWDSAYLSELTTARFAPALLDELDSIQYEDHHPPLYYLLASLVFKLSAGDLVALRLFSLLLGGAVVATSYFVSRGIRPDLPQVALGAMALTAFLPQHLHILSAVNNDGLAELLVGLTLLWLLRYLRTDAAPVWQLGLIVGLAFWTKLTIYFLALPALLAILLKWRHKGEALRALLRSALVFTLVAGVIGGVWWLRNIGVYGFPDFVGLAAHDRVVADQLRTADFIAAHGGAHFVGQLLSVSFKSFWGQFGWMALPLDNVLGGWIYRGFALFTLVGCTGALLAARQSRTAAVEREPARKIQAAVRAIFLTTALLVLLQFAYYNAEFLQWQGRYLFPALIPIAFTLVFGIDHWRVRLLGKWEAARWLTPLALLCLVPLDVYLLFRVIAPGLSPA